MKANKLQALQSLVSQHDREHGLQSQEAYRVRDDRRDTGTLDWYDEETNRWIKLE